MKIFLDTANLDEIKEGASWGIVDGVTTNPSLIAKESKDLKETIKAICEIVDGPISSEVLSENHEDMIKEARELAKIHKNIVVKIPMTIEGLKAVKVLSAEGIHTNVTLIFSANQALLAAKAGATYVSPFLGRLDDIGIEGMELVRTIVEIFDIYGYDTQVIAASIRHPMHVIDAALAGSHIATIPMKVLKQMAAHPLTDNGIEKFNNDWKNAFNK